MFYSDFNFILVIAVLISMVFSLTVVVLPRPAAAIVFRELEHG